MLPVRLVNVRPLADISGVITAMRSSAVTSLFSASIKGARILTAPSAATNRGSRNNTMTRARGSCAARRISFIVDGSRAVVWGREVPTLTCSNWAIF